MKGSFGDWFEFIAACTGIVASLILFFFLGLIIYIEITDPHDVIEGNPMSIIFITSVIIVATAIFDIFLLKKYFFRKS